MFNVLIHKYIFLNFSYFVLRFLYKGDKRYGWNLDNGLKWQYLRKYNIYSCIRVLDKLRLKYQINVFSIIVPISLTKFYANQTIFHTEKFNWPKCFKHYKILLPPSVNFCVRLRLNGTSSNSGRILICTFYRRTCSSLGVKSLLQRMPFP